MYPATPTQPFSVDKTNHLTHVKLGLNSTERSPRGGGAPTQDTDADVVVDLFHRNDASEIGDVRDVRFGFFISRHVHDNNSVSHRLFAPWG